MKRIWLALALLLSCSSAYAQPIYVMNEDGSTYLPSEKQTSNMVAVDRALRMLVSVSGGPVGPTGPLGLIPVSNSAGLNGPLASINGYYNVGTDTIEAASTTTVLNLTAHAARVGDLIYPTGGTAGNIGVQIPVCSVATNSVTLCYPLPATPSTDAITIRRPAPLFTPLEDSVAVDGDPLLPIAGRVNTSQAPQAANGDYTYLALDTAGQQMISLVYPAGLSAGASPVRLEDQAFGNTEALVVSGSQAVSAIAQTVSATGDVAPAAMDLGNRLITTMAPAGETGTSCSTEETGTSARAILSAVPSNRWYVTSLNCSNNSAVASRITFLDGASAKAVGGVGTLAATGGDIELTFNPPIRGSVNTAFNFQLTTTATATICCASAYFSTI
jgi:hypothetical protein